MPIKYIAPINDMLTGTLSILSNIVLIILVKYRSTKELKVYSRLLFLNSIVDLFYTASVLVTQTVGYLELLRFLYPIECGLKSENFIF